jgi:phospholipid/cholesterol/gamma-HCH transport system permease protein
MVKVDGKIAKFFYKIGKKITSAFLYVGSVSVLTAKSFYFTFKPPFKIRHVFQQANFVGVNSFLIVSLIALFTGVVLALQSAYALQRFSGEVYVAGLVALSMTRELGPVLTALVIAGRVGAAISAELGTMKVTEQIDALRTLATNPIKYLVVPRLVALVFMLPILTIYADAIGIFGGYMVGVWKLGIGSSMYLKMSFDSLVFKDIFTGLFKSVIFALIIAIIGCYEGLTTEGGAEGVGKSTTLAVVISFILIIASDCLFTAFFYFALE